MWKIEYLRLKGFTHIHSGLGKKDVVLDLRGNENVVNIIIGKMGSGKSAILGHLQPFASYGTLDIRNQVDPIFPEEDGLKEITYRKGNDTFAIQHIYSWNKHSKSHNTKSFIQLNDTELNPNGNSGSFKGIVFEQFGIEQNFLRLLRLGPNVSNVIQMKTTERKQFIASLLPDTETYSMLYKNLSEDMRAVNASMGVLTKKLVSLSSDEEDELAKKLQSLVSEQNQLNAFLGLAKTEYFKKKGELSVILKQDSIEDIQHQVETLTVEMKNLHEQIEALQASLRKSSADMSAVEIMRETGKLEMELRQIDSQILFAEEELKKDRLEQSRLEDLQSIRGNQDHITDLRRSLDQLEKRYALYKARMGVQKIPYSYQYLASFIDSLSLIKLQIDDILTYSPEAVTEIYHSDKSILSAVARKADMLNGRIYNLQNQVANIRFAAKYRPPYPLMRPPLCPTESCPYFQTHPDYIASITNRGELSENSELGKILDQIAQLNATKARYDEYPMLYQKIGNLKRAWADAKPILTKLSALNTTSLYSVLINPSARRWYDHDKLTAALEQVKAQEDFYEVERQVIAARQEIASIENDGAGDIIAQLEACRASQLRHSNEVHRLALEKTRAETKLAEMREQYDIVEHRDEIQVDLTRRLADEQSMLKSIDNLEADIATAKEIEKDLIRLGNEMTRLEAQIDDKTSGTEKIRTRLADIRFTKKEMGEVYERREVLKEILAAVSTKEGIPLILVKVFLDDCREILNDLISEVFSDGLEILKFDITDSEFKIPYAVNGHEISDVSTASQGQQAIISIALSFALVMKSMFDYNIMLLDEVDGPLYKRDREKFIIILFKYLQSIGAKQVFMISHNNAFDNVPANVIMTTEELVEQNPYQTVIPLY